MKRGLRIVPEEFHATWTDKLRYLLHLITVSHFKIEYNDVDLCFILLFLFELETTWIGDKKKKRKKRNSADKKSIECDDGAPIRLSAAFKNISYKSLDEKAKEKEVRGRRLTDSCVHDGKTDC